MNPITHVRAWWREWRRDRDQRQQDTDELTRDGLRWLHPPDTGQLAIVETGSVVPTAEQLREIRPTDAADRRISPDRLIARDHTPADRPGHRVAPDPTDEEDTTPADSGTDNERAVRD